MPAMQLRCSRQRPIAVVISDYRMPNHEWRRFFVREARATGTTGSLSSIPEEGKDPLSTRHVAMVQMHISRDPGDPSKKELASNKNPIIYKQAMDTFR